MKIYDHLRMSSQRNPDKKAVILENTYLTYGELLERVNRFSIFLQENIIDKGDRVIVGLGNTIETIISIYAINRLDCIFIPLNQNIKPAKMKSILDNCSPSVIITDPTFLNDKMKNVIISKGTTILSRSDVNMKYRGSQISSKSHSSDDVSCIIYTSGSTGDPKGVTLTHDNIDFASTSIIKYLRNVEDDVILNCLPLSFDYGLYQVLMSIKLGATLVLEKSFTFFSVVLNRINENKVTGFPLVPAMAEILIRMRNLEKFDLSSVRYVTNTAQAMPISTVEGLRKIIPDADIFLMYGLTECKRTTYLEPEMVDKKPGSVGKAIPNTEIFLLDEKGQKITIPGEIGILAIKGQHIMRGYWNDEASTNKIIKKDGITKERYLISGDYFKFDEDGDYYFIQRADDQVKIGGEKATPIEVETVINMIPGIESCVVIPIKDKILGNVFNCVYLGDSRISIESIKKFCEDRIEKYLIPKRIVRIEKFPLTHNGKIDKRMIISKYLS